MAVDAGFRPTSLLLRKQPHSKWTERDFIAYEAVQMYEAEHSTSHGEAIYITRSGDPGLRVSIQDRIDMVDEALAEFDETNNKKKKPPKGVSRWPELVYFDNAAQEITSVPRGGRARERYMKIATKQIDAERTGLLNPELGVETKKPAKGYDPAEYGDGV